MQSASYIIDNAFGGIMKNPITAVVFALFVPFILSISADKAFAAEICHSKLVKGFYDEYQRLPAALRDRAMYAELCSLEYREAQNAIKRAQQFGRDRELGLTYGLVSLDDFSPDSGAKPEPVAAPAPSPADRLSEDRFSQWKSGYCVQNATADPSRAAEFLMQRAGAGNSETARSAGDWSACMRKQPGLTCWATPAGASAAEQEEEFLFNVNWTSTGSHPQALPEVEYSYLTRGGIGKFEGAGPSRILPVGYKLKAGTQQIPVTRPADKGVIATLKVNHAGTEHSCKVFIPGDKDFSLSEPFINRLKLKYPG
jgi:hypothetical protein